MNPPNEEMANEEAAANDNTNTNTTRAAASNNGGSASGTTIEAAPPPSTTARAITMASTSTLIAMSKRSLGLADGGNEDDSYGSGLVNDGKKPAPSKGMAELKFDANSTMAAEVGQKLNLNLMHAANAGSNLEVVEDEDGHPIAPATKDQYKPPLSLFAEASVRNLKQQKKEDVKVEKDGTKEVEKDSTAMLKGTLTYSDQDGIRSHVIEGVWKFKREKGPFNRSFGLCRVLAPHEDKNIPPKSGLYNGSFAYEYQVGVSNHKISGIVEEHNVKISFLEDKGVTNKLSVKGNGINRFGTFKLKGTATKKFDNPPLYELHLRKKQTAAPSISQVQVSSSSAAATIMATTPSHNEATVPGVTVEAPNSSTATATIMSDSSLAVALFSRPLGHTNDMYNNNTAADVDMDAEPAINNRAAAYPKRGAFFQIETVRKAAADLKEEEENAKDDAKSQPTTAKSAAARNRAIATPTHQRMRAPTNNNRQTDNDAKVEEIDEDEVPRRDDYDAMLHEADRKAKPNKLETIEGGNAPMPPSIIASQYDDMDAALKDLSRTGENKKSQLMPTAPERERELNSDADVPVSVPDVGSTVTPAALQNENSTTDQRTGSRWGSSALSSLGIFNPSFRASQRGDNGGRRQQVAGTEQGLRPEAVMNFPPQSMPSSEGDEETAATPPPILEATLVEDIPLYPAVRISDSEQAPTQELSTPTWWRRHRAGLVSLVFGAMAAIIVMLVIGDEPTPLALNATPLVPDPTSSPALTIVDRDKAVEPTPQTPGPTSAPVLTTLSPVSTSEEPSDNPSSSRDPSFFPSFKPSTLASAKPSLSFEARLQSSALELVPSEEIVPYNSHTRVAIYGDTAVSGAQLNDNGCVFVHVVDDTGKWTEQAKLVAPDGSAEDYFRFSVGVYGDTAIVGAYGDDDNGSISGSAHVFVRNNGVWTHQAKLLAPDGSADDLFGYSVGIYGDTAIVGANRDDDNGSKSGSVHLFVRNNGIWTHQAKLLAPDGSADDRFGMSVGVYGDTAIIGADGDDDNGSNSGSVHLFVRNNGIWTHQAKLVAPDGSVNDYFGASVGVYDDTAIIGAWGDDDNGSNSGSVHVFIRNNGVWTHQAKLVALDGSADDDFGRSMGIYGDTVIIGAPYDDDNGSDSGSVHLFVRNGVTWTHQAKLVAPDGSAYDRFGRSGVNVYNGTIISGSGNGEVYVFQM